MRRDFIPGLLLLVIFIPSIIIYYNYDQAKKNRLRDRIRDQYSIIFIEEELHGYITNVIYQLDPNVFRNDPHSVYVTFNDSLNKRISAVSADAKPDEKQLLDDIIKIGDYLKKKSGSNKLDISKIQNGDTLKYSFVLCDDFGYPLK
jgi:hypothetical protein